MQHFLVTAAIEEMLCFLSVINNVEDNGSSIRLVIWPQLWLLLDY